MRSVRSRLLWSFVGVAIVGAAVFAVAVRVMVPRLFDHTMGSGNGMGSGQGHGMATERDAVVSSVNTATLVALAATLLVSAAVAVWLSRREVRHLDQLRATTRRLAEGEYDARVTPPRERELAALADDVNDLAVTLAATERRRAALINDVAHEMRTPLTAMTGVVEGYDDGLFTADELAATVTTELSRLEHLAHDLAAVSRAEEGQLSLDLTAGDLAGVARAAVERLRPQFAAAGITLDLEGTATAPVRVDHERIMQAITNLLRNALAYTPRGGSVVVRVGAGDGVARLEVTDTGRGLRGDDLARVFERFYRADPTGHAGGTGIGLTIARAIARAHGGDLVASSPGLGSGATFTFSLPLGSSFRYPTNR